MTVKQLIATLMRCPAEAVVYIAEHPKADSNILQEASGATKYKLNLDNDKLYTKKDPDVNDGQTVFVIWG